MYSIGIFMLAMVGLIYLIIGVATSLTVLFMILLDRSTVYRKGFVVFGWERVWTIAFLLIMNVFLWPKVMQTTRG